MDLLQKLLNLDVMKWVGVASSVVSALIAVAVLIPGEQPEKFLQAVLDLLAKISKK